MFSSSQALLTDLYQFTMMQSYWDRGMTGIAVFELFFRRLPPARNFLMAAGLAQALDYLQGLRFTAEELRWIATLPDVTPAFLERLGKLRFTGDVDAMPEGTVFFAEEPVLRVVAPLPEAQLVESRLMNLVHFQTLIASKAARVVLQAPGKQLVDFGLRRAHGAEAGLLGARAGYLAGMSGTATAQAGLRFGIPVFGTMAHSFIQAHVEETSAFEHFARDHPGHVTLLIDTYDTEAAARKVVALAARLAGDNINIDAVRLDSGDLAGHAHRVRAILDAAGLTRVRIFASGGLDEYQLHDLLHRRHAPIDGFGLGSALDTSSDAPALDCAYKLQEYGGRPTRKRSEGKATWPGRKQVYRRLDANGQLLEDVLALESEAPDGEPLLVPIMRAGTVISPCPTLAEARMNARMQLRRLPTPLRSLQPVPSHPVLVSPGLRALAVAVDREIEVTADSVPQFAST